MQWVDVYLLEIKNKEKVDLLFSFCFLLTLNYVLFIAYCKNRTIQIKA